MRDIALQRKIRQNVDVWRGCVRGGGVKEGVERLAYKCIVNHSREDQIRLSSARAIHEAHGNRSVEFFSFPMAPSYLIITSWTARNSARKHTPRPCVSW